jgi:dTDP-L-rhamnose 4-epimerase
MIDTGTVKKILITGGAGYIGNTLIESLPESVEIVVIDNFHIDTEYKRQANAKLAKKRRLTLIQANTSETEKYQHVLHDVDIVLYMASLNSYKESNSDPLLYIRENDIHLQQFLNALSQHSPDVKKIIVTSTRGVYGEGPYLCTECHSRMYPDSAPELKCTLCQSTKLIPQKITEEDMTKPNSFYGITKKLQEDMVRLYAAKENIAVDIFRIFNVYGEDQGKYYSNIGVVPQMFEQIQKKKEIYLSGGGTMTRDFVYIGDLVQMLVASIFGVNSKRNTVEIYHAGSGRPTTIQDIANFFESLGYTFARKTIPASDDIQYSVADNTKTSKVFGIREYNDMFNFLTTYYKKEESA